MNDIIAYTSLGGVVLALLGVGKFWMDMGATRRDALAALDKSEANATGLSEFRAAVAEKYASSQALAMSETRLTQAIEGMRSDFRDMTGRIDSILRTIQGQH